VSHPGDPSLLAREHRQEEEQVAVEALPAARDALRGGNHASDVAVVRHTVEADCERFDVILDGPFLRGIHDDAGY
jgi:hypothetical protein